MSALTRRTAPGPQSRWRRLPARLLVIGLGAGVCGCAVVTVAGAAAGAVISVAGAVVSTGVAVTGKVVTKTIDVITPAAR